MDIPAILEEEPEQDLVNDAVPQTPFANPDEPSPLQPFTPFDGFSEEMYDQCVQMIGKSTCDLLFGR